MSEELKRCPFCGGEPMMEFGEEVWSIFCANIPKSGHVGGCLVQAEASAEDKAQAIKRWNHRAESAELEALKEKLRVAVEALDKIMAQKMRTGDAEELAEIVTNVAVIGEEALAAIRDQKGKK